MPRALLGPAVLTDVAKAPVILGTGIMASNHLASTGNHGTAVLTDVCSDGTGITCPCP